MQHVIKRPPRRVGEQPNVVVFLTDQQRWDTAGVHGNPTGLTPNFDRVATEATHLNHSFTCQPVCGPARSCLQTGMYATQTGVHHNGLQMRSGLPLLAEQFAGGGYRTGYIGKWHLGGAGEVGPVPRERRGGYQDWLASNTLEFTSDAYATRMFDEDNQPVDLPGYRVDAVTDAAIRYIDTHRAQPFFLFISYIEPHFQNHRDDYPAPDGYEARYRGSWVPPDLAALGGTTHQHLAGYYGMVKRLDEAFGRLLDALKSLALQENTVVLFTSDHGCHFKTRNNEYKRSCHEASIRVPTAICGPGFDGGGRVQQLVSLVDLPPTLLDAAGLPVPERMQGSSILPVVRGGAAAPWPDDVFIQISETQVGRAVRTRRWKYAVTAPDRHPTRDATSDHYVEEYLYDLMADPYEMHNLLGLESHVEVSTRLRQRLTTRVQEIEGIAVRVEPAPAVTAPQFQVLPGEADA